MAQICVGKGNPGELGASSRERKKRTKILHQKQKGDINGVQRDSASVVTSSSWFPRGIINQEVVRNTLGGRVS